MIRNVTQILRTRITVTIYGAGVAVYLLSFRKNKNFFNHQVCNSTMFISVRLKDAPWAKNRSQRVLLYSKRPQSKIRVVILYQNAYWSIVKRPIRVLAKKSQYEFCFVIFLNMTKRCGRFFRLGSIFGLWA